MRAMRNLSLITAALGCALFVSACGDFAYKRGAGTADLEQDRSACHAAAKPGLSYEQCMADRGWTLQNFDEEPLLGVVGISKDNRDMSSSIVTETASVPVQSVGANGAAANPTTKENPVAPKPIAKPTNPMDQFKVNSFWKLGGSSGELQGAIDSCVATLGDAHRPPADRQLMTRGLLQCLRGKGWYGVANK